MTVDVEQRIRDRAYAIWLDEGCPQGRDAEHWLQAERAILAEAAANVGHSPVVAVVKAPRKTTNARPRAVKTIEQTGGAPEAVADELPKARKPRSRKTDTAS
ncbi:DUF2934 domain-containing protein [Azospirillum humicireducens]|uniref:DUF2934 domain-containing protein n=1 Tax=Azospirillum humicireducens TaxID=1226968 RepID=A0A160JFL6_9PROT|nr:DUF2934 domain-containing protein [Azospirillum humicireducens]ANC91692.1 DUF2934 domain-containing protein [Azospirillum humicireducens]